MVNLTDLSAREAADTIDSVETSAQELAQAYLDRICAREDEIGAFEYLDPDYIEFLRGVSCRVKKQMSN